MSDKPYKPVIKTYDNIAKKYDKKFENYLNETFKVAIETLSLTGKERILDIACGTGELEQRAIKKFPNQYIVGVDITKSMLVLAREKCKGAKNVHFLHGASQKLPVEDASFDIAITCSALHYMKDPEAVFGEAARALVPNGRLIIIDWCRDFLWAKFYDWLSKVYKRSHHKVYSLREIQHLLLDAGLTILNTKTFSVPPFWRMMCVEAKKERVSRWSSAVGG